MYPQKQHRPRGSTVTVTWPTSADLAVSRIPVYRLSLKHAVLVIALFALVILALLYLARATMAKQIIEDNCTTIEIPTGKLRGQIVDVFQNGTRVVAFYGIPFAENPSGERRFKKPNCPSSWEGVFDATFKRPPCKQAAYQISPSYYVDNKNTTEDCLHLNVWVPDACVRKGRNKTVFVYIYGGSFLHGGNSYDIYDGRFLSAFGDVIVVVPNYRLGVFGFLNAETSDAPGNLALHDQIMALRWVYKYSEYFGGNPNDITVAGQSAGAISIALLTSSPKLDQSLIKKMIMMSGSSYTPLIKNTGDAAKNNFATIANEAGCKAGDVEGKLSCLRSKSGWDVLEAQQKSRLWTAPSFRDDVLPEYPTDGMRRFLRASEKRLLLSVTHSEGDTFFYALFEGLVRDGKRIDGAALNEAFGGLGMPNFLIDTLIAVFSTQYSVYAKDYSGWRDLLGDVLFYCPVLYYAGMFKSMGGRNIYFLMYEPKPSFSDIPGEYATHGEDSVMLFGFPFLYPYFTTDRDRAISKHLMLLYTDFAKNRPMPKFHDGSDWPTFTSADAPIGMLTHSGIHPKSRKSCSLLNLYYMMQRRSGSRRSLNFTGEILAAT